MSPKYDLRSDTVTRPTSAMREYMLRADVGDDVYAEDPTVNALQERVAAMFGKEAGLFVPTGSMSNQLAIKVHTRPGDEILCEAGAHIYYYETGAPALISGVQVWPLQGVNGALDADQVEEAVRPPAYYYPRTRLVCLENTHNKAGGRLLPIEGMEAVSARARGLGLAVHLDGARIWNAHVETGVPLTRYGALADTVSVCFSKGLGAPAGSMLLGPRALLVEAHKLRKILGGGMRQIGILAAAADYALDHHLARLADDHAHARSFAAALSSKTSFRTDPSEVETNMVMLRFPARQDATDAAAVLAAAGIATGLSDPFTVRAVFHLDISAADTTDCITIVTQLFD